MTKQLLISVIRTAANPLARRSKLSKAKKDAESFFDAVIYNRHADQSYVEAAFAVLSLSKLLLNDASSADIDEKLKSVLTIFHSPRFKLCSNYGIANAK